MTDKEIIWETLKFIELKAPKNGYINVSNTNWRAYDKNRKIHLRRLLVANKLVRLGDNDQWSFQLTGEAIVAEESDFKDDGRLKNKDKTWIRTIQTTAIGAVLGGVLTGVITIGIEAWKLKHPQTQQTNIVVRPTIQIVHDLDTVLLKPVVKKKKT